METFEGIYENGVVRPLVPVTLPEHTKVTVTPQTDEKPPLGCNSPELYALLSERYDSGDREGAARHNEHQP